MVYWWKLGGVQVAVPWTVEFYRTAKANPVYDYLISQDDDVRLAIFRVLDLVREHGPMAPLVRRRDMGDKLWEFRITAKGEHRLFYVSLKRQRVVIVHAVNKKGQQAPKKDLALAHRRAAEVLD